MTKSRWKSRIKKACKDAGTYKNYFDSVIDTLAAILEKRDAAQDEFDALMGSGAKGGRLIIEHTNKAGATYCEQNPLIRLINDLNRDALAYWKELGLTIASLKRINGSAVRNDREPSTLEKALMKLGD